MVKIKLVREKETDALKSELNEARRHLFDLRSQAVTEKLENPSQLGQTRRQIAQILTILRERELVPIREQEKADKASAAQARRDNSLKVIADRRAVKEVRRSEKKARLAKSAAK